MRVPFIIVGPGVDKNTTIKEPIYLQDIMPTTLELAGTEVPKSVEFKSLLPILHDDDAKHYENIYGCYKEDLQRAIVSDEFKLILYPKIDVMRLYNLEDDPLEETDLASNPKYAKTIQNLLSELHILSLGLNDPLKITQ